MSGHKGRIGVIGATSIIGKCLLPLLLAEGWNVVAFSRRVDHIKKTTDNLPVIWQLLTKSNQSDGNDIHQLEKPINFWISLAPITTLSEYFTMLSNSGARHIVAVSSTSRFTKNESLDQAEKELAKNLAEGEEALAVWAKKEKVTFTILRPTLVYGMGQDKNVSVIASFIRRFSFFPVLGVACGLRQPVHAQDVALCCVAALSLETAINKTYNISGEETISYREMISRIFDVLDKKPRIVTFPLWLFRLAIFFLRLLPPFRKWSVAMAQRMNQDLIFSHEEARRDMGFNPRPFQLTEEDLPH